ncbi:MAG TPA: exopolysaccharide biosynthesis protein [Clostridiales bacterium]|nr:exopolysaccharide biosynthesis protein [Clostridiales bacterium]HCJ88075.1 exopolysaccharide biosynthesis protein [Clostridiales bacterium]
MKRHFSNMVFALILIAYTVYAALDTFVIVRVLTPDTLPTATAEASTAPTEAPTTVPTATEPPAEQAATVPISTDTEYHDDQIDIVLTTMRVENTTVYVADVQIADISLLKTALAGNTYARNLTETTSVQAANAGAILAINGDYYGAQERGYVLRNGVLYRASAQSGTDALVIGADGNFRIIHEGETSADTLVREGAWQVLTFGPALINGGQVTVSSSDEVGRAMTSNPRTAIGQISEGHYLLVVSDGRTKESAGLSLQQLAELMQSLGAQIAYNLDGGGSSTMVFQGRVVNSPTTNGRSIRERSVSDIVYIGY